MHQIMIGNFIGFRFDKESSEIRKKIRLWIPHSPSWEEEDWYYYRHPRPQGLVISPLEIYDLGIQIRVAGTIKKRVSMCRSLYVVGELEFKLGEIRVQGFFCLCFIQGFKREVVLERKKRSYFQTSTKCAFWAWKC